MAETLRASSRLTLAVLTSRVLGLAREALFAALFGAGALADAFQVAYRIPNLLRDLFAEGALSSAFVPTFTAALKNQGEERAHALGNLVMSGVLLVTGTLAALGIVFAEEVVVAISAGFGGDPEKVALAARLCRVMMPILALVSLSAVWMGMLNARRKFMAPAFAPAAFNVASIACGVGLLLYTGEPEDGLLIWSGGTLAAGAVQALFQLPSLWRLGYRPWPKVTGLFTDPGVRRIVRLMAPAIVGLAAVQINIFVNTRFAGELGDGPVAQLSYAFRLFYLPIGMFGVALATVTTTRVAEDEAAGNRDRLVAGTAEGLSAAWMLTLASAVGLCVLARPVVSIIFERGAFTAADTEATALVLQAYLLGLVPYSLVKMLAPAFYAVDRPRIPLLASSVAVAANIVFNALTYREFGAPGIALGTTVGAVLNFAVLRVSYGRVVGSLREHGSVPRLVGLLLANALMGAVVYGAWWGMTVGLAAAGLDGLSARALFGAALFGCIGLGFVVYVAALSVLKYPGAEVLRELPAKIWRKLRG